MDNFLMLPSGRLRVGTIALAALVLIGSVTSATIAWATGIDDDIAFKVDGDEVAITTLDRRIEVLSAIYGVTPPTARSELAEFKRAAAKSLAVSTVIERSAASRDVAVAEKSLQDELKKIIEDQNGDRATFVKFLGDKGLTEADVIDELRRTRITSALFDEVTANVAKATKEDARREYDKRRDEMRTPETRRLANIVVKTQDEAAKVVDRLDKGAKFADVAAATSLDSTTSAEGGDLGTAVTQDRLEPAYGKAAFEAKKGEIFGPVQTQSGWNVGRVLNIQPGKPLAYDEVESTLLSALTSRRKAEAWVDWLNKQISSADVVYADTYRPDDPTVDANETGEAAQP